MLQRVEHRIVQQPFGAREMQDLDTKLQGLERAVKKSRQDHIDGKHKPVTVMDRAEGLYREALVCAGLADNKSES